MSSIIPEETYPEEVAPDDECEECESGEEKDCCCEEEGGGISNTSENPVRYGDGEVMLSETDLMGGGFGVAWGHTRIYGNQLSRNDTGWNGNSWLVRQNEYLAFVDDGSDSRICVVRGMGSSWWFTESAGNWSPNYGTHATLTHDSTNKEYTLFSEHNGKTWVFYDDHTDNGDKKGRLKQITAAGGQVADLSYDSNGLLTDFAVVSGSEELEYLYTYNTSDRLETVTMRINGSAEVRKVTYAYYGASENYGMEHDLKKVTVEAYLDSQWTTLYHRYYRYYGGLLVSTSCTIWVRAPVRSS